MARRVGVAAVVVAVLGLLALVFVMRRARDGAAPRASAAVSRSPLQVPSASAIPREPAVKQARLLGKLWQGEGDEAEAAPMSALEERDEAIRKIRASGSSTRFAELIRRVEEQFTEAVVKLDSQAKIGPWECHAGGCFAHFQHAHAGHADDVASAITRTESFEAWPGNKMRSGAIELPNGRAEVTWILFAPEASQAPSGGGL